MSERDGKTEGKRAQNEGTLSPKIAQRQRDKEVREGARESLVPYLQTLGCSTSSATVSLKSGSCQNSDSRSRCSIESVLATSRHSLADQWFMVERVDNCR